MLFAMVAFSVRPVEAAPLTSASISLGDSRPDQAAVSYDFSASGVTLSSVRCIRLIFATTVDGTTVPDDMNTTGAALSASSDYIPTPASWTVDAAVNGTIEITYASGETPGSASARNVILTGIENGSVDNATYFVRFDTFNNVDCTTSPVDSASASFMFTDGQEVSLTVDPTLSFIVASVASGQTVNGATTTATTSTTTIPFGTVTASANAIAAQDLTVSTNAVSGYTVHLRYTGALTNGGATIDDHTGGNADPTDFSSAGTEAFGYTTNDFTLGTGTTGRFNANKWAAPTTSNAEVAYSAAAVSNETTRVGFQVGIDGSTPAGEYTSTVIYTAMPIY